MSEEEEAPRLAPRVVFASIAVFWLFYWVIWSLRATFLYHDQLVMLVARLIVSLLSIGVTWLVYLLMRRVPVARLRRSIGAAAILALPAAAIYASLNWVVFDYWFHPMVARASMMKPVTPTAPAGAVAPKMPQVAVGKMMGDEEKMTPLATIVDQTANGYFFFIAWCALYLALCYAGEARAHERTAARLRAAAQAAELKALRYQINPHFLFNTLNSLSALVLSGKRVEAECMILNLATFFRSSLVGDPTEDVPLSQEILLQQLYLDIEAVRFPGRVSVEIAVPESLRSVCVPGLILQPLVENVIKHAVARTIRPVTIRIAAHERDGTLHLSVVNDDELAESAPPAIGVGLANVRDRMAARFGVAGECRWAPLPEGGFAVHLAMPASHDGC